MTILRSRSRRFIVLVSTAAFGALLLSACSNNDSATTGSSGDHNKADVAFVQEMIPHHESAIEMAKLVETRSDNSEVKALATRIENAQDPEIRTMRGWLKDWDVKEVSLSPGMEHGGMPKASMAKLENASGAEFDRLFLTEMIAHHESAIDMASGELKDGKSADVEKLAESIRDSQTLEVKEMKQLLVSVPTS